AVLARLRREGTREQLVPGAEARPFAVHPDTQLALIDRGVLQVGVEAGQAKDILIERPLNALGNVALASDEAGCGAEVLAIIRGGAVGGAAEQVGPDEQINANVLIGTHPFFEIAPPALEERVRADQDVSVDLLIGA